MLTRRLIMPVCLFFTFCTGAYGEIQVVRLRPVDSLTRTLLEVGRERSDVFRALADRIDRSDLIVHVRTAMVLPHGIDGRLQFAVSVPGARYLRVTVRGNLAPDRLVAVIGHELMHAVEVADHPAVRDRESFRELYARIGHSHNGVAFDTRAAVDAGNRVLAELRAY
jgi:hypothetical protein